MKLYSNPKKLKYFSPRYYKWIIVPKNYVSNGADIVLDFYPKSWFIHDWVCGSYFGGEVIPKGGVWEDDTPMTNWQLSRVFADVIRDEAEEKLKDSTGFLMTTRNCFGWLILPTTRFWGTWLFGGGKARENGMW